MKKRTTAINSLNAREVERDRLKKEKDQRYAELVILRAGIARLVQHTELSDCQIDILELHIRQLRIAIAESEKATDAYYSTYRRRRTTRARRRRTVLPKKKEARP